jgi:uncharacterized membrane protein YtjA (UPF0391 family)
MSRLALLFLVIAVVGALFGFGIFPSMHYEAGRLVFIIFLVLAGLALLSDCFRRDGRFQEDG